MSEPTPPPAAAASDDRDRMRPEAIPEADVAATGDRDADPLAVPARYGRVLTLQQWIDLSA
jgi:hypothetical protein